MRYIVKINKKVEIDTAKDWGNDHDALMDMLREQEVNGSPSKEEIQVALEAMMEDDMDSVLGDEGINETDCQITVLDTVGIPDIEDDEE